MERNESTIKCPRDLEQQGHIVELPDVVLKNHNPISRYNQKLGKRRSRSSGSDSSSSSSSSSSDSSDNDCEDFEDFHVDGYHVAHVGEIVDSKYVLLKKLGFGHFSTVWLAFKLSDKQLYALKILKSHPKYLESGFEEEEILYDVASNYKDEYW